jgi:spore germination protein GerM
MRIKISSFAENRFSLVILPVVASLASLILVSCTNDRIISENQSATRVVSPVQNQIETSTIQIWLVKPQAGELTLVPVQRKQYRENKLESAIKELLDGANAEEASTGLASEIPRGTILLGINKIGSDFELNLSKRFNSGGGTNSMEARIDQISRTVRDSGIKEKVFLNVEGERLTLAGGEGIEVKQPLN